MSTKKFQFLIGTVLQYILANQLMRYAFQFLIGTVLH